MPPGPPAERRKSLADIMGEDPEIARNKAAGMTLIELEGGYKTWVKLAKRPKGMAPPQKKKAVKKKTKAVKGSNTSVWSLDAVILAGHDRASLRHFLVRRGVPPQDVDAAVDDAIYKYNKEHPGELYKHTTEEERVWAAAEDRAINCHGSDWEENIRTMFKQPIVSKYKSVRPMLSMLKHGHQGRSIDMCDPGRYNYPEGAAEQLTEQQQIPEGGEEGEEYAAELVHVPDPHELNEAAQ